MTRKIIITPAKGVSQRCPQKNLKLIRPYLDHMTAADMSEYELCIVTDCPDITAICHEYGVMVAHRPAWTCGRGVSSYEPVMIGAEHMRADNNDKVALVELTSLPYPSADMLSYMYQMGPCIAVTPAQPAEKLLRIDSNGRVQKVDGYHINGMVMPSQCLPDAYLPAGVIVNYYSELLDWGTLYTPCLLAHIVDRATDVDNPQDMEAAQCL